MVARHAKSHAFTDGLSRRDAQRVTLERAESAIASLPEDDVPLAWTPEHVARRLIAAFDTLIMVGGRVGPRSHANGWPAMLQEYSDLTDEDAYQHAQEAFARARRRPSAGSIAMMEDALAWPMRFRLPSIQADAALTWSYCKASGRSIAALLRARVEATKSIMAEMQRHENERIRVARLVAITDAGQWRERAARERHIALLPEQDRAERWAKLTIGMRNRIERDLRPLIPRMFTPSDVASERVLSRTSLDRHLPAALGAISGRLHEAEERVV